MAASAGTQSSGRLGQAAASRYFFECDTPRKKRGLPLRYAARSQARRVKLKQEKSGDDIRRSATVLRSLASLALGTVRGACSGWWLRYLCRSACTTKGQRRSDLP